MNIEYSDVKNALVDMIQKYNIPGKEIWIVESFDYESFPYINNRIFNESPDLNRLYKPIYQPIYKPLDLNRLYQPIYN